MKKITNEILITRYKEKHGNLYDYSLVNYKGALNKVKIICPVHGEFEQKPFDHANGRGCKKCGRNLAAFKTKKDTNFFIKKSNTVHGTYYDYSQSNYTGNNKKIKIICPIHGEFEQLAGNHLAGSGCIVCGNSWNSSKRSKNKREILFKNKAKELYGNIYDFEKSVYIKNNIPVQVYCNIHNGVFLKTPNQILDGSGQCPICYGSHKTKIKNFAPIFFKRCKERFKNPVTYNEEIYNGLSCNIEYVCPKHGKIKNDIACNHIRRLNNNGCIKCRNISKLELFVRDILEENHINYKKQIKLKYNNKRYEMDIFIPSKKIAIELNGLYWHSEHRKGFGGLSPDYHIKKYNTFEKLGIRLITIFEHEIENNKEIVTNKLKHILNISNTIKIFARKCEISKIGSKTSNNFLKENHLQGGDKSPIRYGLYHKEELVAVMTFSKKRGCFKYNKTNEKDYELVRFCVKNKYSVIGSANKLLKKFEIEYKPNKIVTYSDKRWYTGNVYEKMGFSHSHDSSPCYWYFNYSNRNKIYHRFNFRKNVLEHKLELYDGNLTEWENMKKNNYDRYWDCGTKVFHKSF